MSSMHSSAATLQPVRSDLTSFRRLWTLAAPLRRELIVGLAYRFLQSFSLGLAFATTIAVICALADKHTMTTAWAWQITGVMAIALFGQLLFGYLANARLYLASFALGGHLRLEMLQRLQALPIGFHLSRDAGDTATVLTTDIQTLESFLADGLPRIAQALGLPLAVLLYLASRDAVLALTAACPVLVAIPVYLRTSRKLAELGIERQDMQATATSRMIEFVQGINVIRAFNRLSKGRQDFEQALRTFRDVSNFMVRRLTAPIILFAVVVMLGIPAMMLMVGLRLSAGAIDPATAVAALVLLFALYGPLVNLVAVMEITRLADASLTRMDRVLEAVPLPQPVSPRAAQGFHVTFDHVRFGYRPGDVVLQDISFEAPPRSMTAIVGPSGSGKSTILNLLARFWDVDQGSIRVGGVDVRELAADALHDLVSVVFQDVYLFSGTIYDNIAFGRKGATTAEVEAAARAAQAHDFIMALPAGYATRVGEAGANLSGGERQRVSIARAILKNAPIVLLDEITASIDPSNQRAIQAALQALVADKTVIVVAHRLSTIRNADQILVVEAGRLVERGRHDALLDAGGLYARLWQSWSAAAHWRLGAKTAQPAST